MIVLRLARVSTFCGVAGRVAAECGHQMAGADARTPARTPCDLVRDAEVRAAVLRRLDLIDDREREVRSADG
jgi:hypothetical protein